ncbi:MAG: YfiR family protein [Proteobacteria bacterium]|nr:YfiR family protein [Pseudomonadota bacterium]
MQLTVEKIKRAVIRSGRISCLLAALFFGLNGTALGQTSEEYRLKAAFIVNFAKFSQWPKEAFASPDDPLSLCVVREKRMRHFFASIEGVTIGGRELDVRYMDEKEDVEGCHMLFFSEEVRRSTFTEMFADVKGKAVLTIGETENFASDGGGINFIVEDKKLRFEINRETAAEQEIKLSSQLLNLAILVDSNK